MAEVKQFTKERPILMSGQMVRAILREIDPKTQTRRAINPQPVSGQVAPHCESGWWMWRRWTPEHRKHGYPTVREGDRRCPYGEPGDRLWVRETYTMAQRIMSLAHTPCYRADEGVTENNTMPDGKFPWKWTPAIHMRREHSRITLEVTGVRVERVQEIGEADAVSEGADPIGIAPSFRDAYRQLWDSLNAKRGFGWDKNPWVWCISFRRINAG